jgi:hypothetical protein
MPLATYLARARTYSIIGPLFAILLGRGKCVKLDKCKDFGYTHGMKQSYLRRYGFTLEEIGMFMGVSRQRVFQLVMKDSSRIDESTGRMRRENTAHRKRIRNQSEKARGKLAHELKIGRMERPLACQDCGREGRIEGHHHDYSKPLDVEWLCPGCHKNKHKDYTFYEWVVPRQSTAKLHKCSKMS